MGAASPVLSDGYSSFTPGLSEINGNGSRFYLPDGQGNSRGLLDSTTAATDSYNWDGFGVLMSRFGSNPTAFAWNGGSGYQTDGDSGLRLLGHRYYDSRTGRFISQDPAGDGDNWYAYCGNDPVSGADPTGLQLEGSGPSPFESMAAGGAGTLGGNLAFLDQYDFSEKVTNIQKAQKKAEAIADNIELVINFVCGWGPDHEVYDMSTERTQQFMTSQDAKQISILLGLAGWPNKASGNIGTVQAFGNSLADLTNDIEWATWCR